MFHSKAIGMSAPQATDQTHAPTALLILGDGTVLKGRGLGAEGKAVGEVCFNTSMTGYQEIMTDPSYAGQIINFTFPHIGNVGANEEDIETVTPAARGTPVRRVGDVGAEHAAAHAGARGGIRRLDVLLVGADIADMREGKGDDLAGVGGVGQNLLVAGHGGVEADLAAGLSGRADADAFDHGAVGKDEEGGRRDFRPALIGEA